MTPSPAARTSRSAGRSPRVTEASPGNITTLPPPSPGSRVDESRNERREHARNHHLHDVRYAGSGVTAGLVFLMILTFAATVLVAQNTDDVQFDFLWFSATLPLAVLLLAAAFLTLALDQVVGSIWRRRRRKLMELSQR